MILFGRNNWGNKGSAGNLQIHWRMQRLVGNDGVVVSQVTGRCFVSQIFVTATCSRTRNVLKNWENQPSELFPKALLWGSVLRRHSGSYAGEAAVILFRLFLSFSCERGCFRAGKLLSAWVLPVKLCHKRGWGGPVARLGQSGVLSWMDLLAQLLIPEWALVAAAPPWMCRRRCLRFVLVSADSQELWSEPWLHEVL